MSEGIVVSLEVVEIQHHHGKGPLSATSAINLAFEEFLHIAAIIEASEGVVDGLQTEGLAQVEVRNRESDVLGNGRS